MLKKINYLNGVILKNRRKICVVINNRANYARIKSFLFLASKSKKIKLDIILGASSILERFGNVSKVIEKDRLKVSSRLFSVVEGDTPLCMAKTTGNLISDLSTEFEKLKPDAVIVIADRYENLAVAIAASYMNIPIIHLQGGEVSGSIDENVRHAITKLSHLHFPATSRSKDYIIKMGEVEHTPYETILHNIYDKERCFSPIPSLALHCTNVNSVFGLSPTINFKKLWEENKV